VALRAGRCHSDLFFAVWIDFVVETPPQLTWEQYKAVLQAEIDKQHQRTEL